MRSIYNFFVIFALWSSGLLIVSPASAAPEFVGALSLRIGDAVIYIPAPAGFVETSSTSPELWKMAQLMSSGYSETIAHYVNKTDFDAYVGNRDALFSQYFFVQTPKSAKQLTATQQQFDKLRFETVSMQSSLRNSIEPRLAKEVERLNKNLISQMGKPLTIGIGQIVPVSINANRSNLFSYSVLTQINASSKEGNYSDTLILTSGVCFIKGKVVMLNSYRLFQTPQDLQTSREFIEKWANELLMTNK